MSWVLLSTRMCSSGIFPVITIPTPWESNTVASKAKSHSHSKLSVVLTLTTDMFIQFVKDVKVSVG